MQLFKNIMIAGMSALLLLAGTSCDDFLDKAPENSVPESSVDYTDMNMAIIEAIKKGTQRNIVSEESPKNTETE